jgi:hypothetical protein
LSTDEDQATSSRRQAGAQTILHDSRYPSHIAAGDSSLTVLFEGGIRHLHFDATCAACFTEALPHQSGDVRHPHRGVIDKLAWTTASL